MITVPVTCLKPRTVASTRRATTNSTCVRVGDLSGRRLLGVAYCVAIISLALAGSNRRGRRRQES